MKVSELIDKLAEVPGDYEVVFKDLGTDDPNGYENVKQLLISDQYDEVILSHIEPRRLRKYKQS